MDLAMQTSPQVATGGLRRERLRAAGKATASSAPASVSPPPSRDGSFAAARVAQEQRAAASLQSIEMMADSAASADAARAGIQQRRHGGRIFQLVDGVWTDVRVSDQIKRVKIKPYSAAYFKLVEALPEIRELLSIGEKVVVAGRSIAIEISGAGVDVLTEREIESVRSNW